MGIIDLFADTGVIAAEEGVLPDALAELSVRLDLAGAGELLTEMTDRTCWQVSHGDQVPGCRCKGTPNPRPTPPPPPRPVNPKGQAS
jgi:hypothetical protein